MKAYCLINPDVAVFVCLLIFFSVVSPVFSYTADCIGCFCPDQQYGKNYRMPINGRHDSFGEFLIYQNQCKMVLEEFVPVFLVDRGFTYLQNPAVSADGRQTG